MKVEVRTRKCNKATGMNDIRSPRLFFKGNMKGNQETQYTGKNDGARP